MLYNMSYLQRLNARKMDSLELGRIKIDLIMLLKILRGTVKVNLYNGFQLHNGGHNNKGKKLKLFKNKALQNVKNTNRVVRVCHYLPGEIIIVSAVKLSQPF